MIENGADVNVKDLKKGWTPLIYAVKEAGSDIFIKENRSTEHIQARIKPITSNDRKPVIKTLIKCGADAKIKDNGGFMAIDYAKRNKELRNTDVLRELSELSY